MTVGHGIGLLLIGLVLSFLVLWGLYKGQEIFDKLGFGKVAVVAATAAIAALFKMFLRFMSSSLDIFRILFLIPLLILVILNEHAFKLRKTYNRIS